MGGIIKTGEREMICSQCGKKQIMPIFEYSADESILKTFENYKKPEIEDTWYLIKTDDYILTLCGPCYRKFKEC